MALKYKATCKKATFTHHESSDIHNIAFNGLNVVLCHEPAGWYAQGIQLNHSSMGDTEKEAVDNFCETLAKTVEAHLNKYGNANHLLFETPKEIKKLLSEDVIKKLKISERITFKFMSFEKELLVFKAPQSHKGELALSR